MRVIILAEQAYWELRKPYDKYLPDSVSADEVEAELDTIQTRFRASITHLGEEGDAWEFPGHYQHVRVFYMYLYSALLYTPELASAVCKAMDGHDDWICELECYSFPGDTDEGSMITPVFLKGDFYIESGDVPHLFAAALDLPTHSPSAT